MESIVAWEIVGFSKHKILHGDRVVSAPQKDLNDDKNDSHGRSDISFSVIQLPIDRPMIDPDWLNIYLINELRTNELFTFLMAFSKWLQRSLKERWKETQADGFKSLELNASSKLEFSPSSSPPPS